MMLLKLASCVLCIENMDLVFCILSGTELRKRRWPSIVRHHMMRGQGTWGSRGAAMGVVTAMSTHMDCKGIKIVMVEMTLSISMLCVCLFCIMANLID